MRKDMAELLPEDDGTVGLDDCIEVEVVTDGREEADRKDVGVSE